MSRDAVPVWGPIIWYPLFPYAGYDAAGKPCEYLVEIGEIPCTCMEIWYLRATGPMSRRLPSYHFPDYDSAVECAISMVRGDEIIYEDDGTLTEDD